VVFHQDVCPILLDDVVTLNGGPYGEHGGEITFVIWSYGFSSPHMFMFVQPILPSASMATLACRVNPVGMKRSTMVGTKTFVNGLKFITLHL
jgi:hypothetical protein